MRAVVRARACAAAVAWALPLAGCAASVAGTGSSPDGGERSMDAGGDFPPSQCWRRVPSPTTASLMDVWAVSRGSAWAVGQAGEVLRWDGSAWTVDRGVPGADRIVLDGVSASGADDVWVVGMAAADAPPGRPLVLHWNGTRWSDRSPSLPPEVRRRLLGVWAAAPDRVYVTFEHDAAPFDRVLLWDGMRWKVERVGSARTPRLVTGRSPASVVVSDGATELWRGPVWTPVDTAVFDRVTPVQINALWTDGRELWIARGSGSPGNVGWFDGTRWAFYPLARTTAEGIWSAGDGEAWAVGIGGARASIATCRRGVGCTEVLATDAGPVLHAVHGTARDDVWAVGSGGLILHCAGP